MLVAVLLLAFAATGCGDDTPSKDASAAAQSPSGATGASAASSGSKSKSDKSESSNKKDKSKTSKSESSTKNGSSDKASGKSGDSDSTDSGGGSNNAYNSTEAPAAIEEAVRDSFAAVVKATDEKDAKYLCEVAYAKEYVASFDTRGGCIQQTEKKFQSFSDYSGKVRSVELVTPQVAAANASLEFTKDGKRTTTEPRVHFKLEDGKWRVFIYTGNNG